MSEQTPETEPTKAQKLNKAYTAAGTLLREAHQSEFNDLMKAEAKKLGIDWAPKLTKKQKAEQELKAILDEFPDLADNLAAIAKAQSIGTPVVPAGVGG